ncbi:MAG: adenylate/guanylate cyclase domain-containing protein [Sinimarinibacterium sp.]|jgi:class 3 adenylate cyclase
MESEVRHATVLIVDIAGSVRLRSLIGEVAAERRIRHVLDGIIAAARSRGGEFIKSYGDDVMAVFERDPVTSAALTAITAQRLAADAGLELYAGLHSGPVEFRETMGHPDAVGLTVNLAARLHKLTEGAPGRIFIAEEWIGALAPDLRARTSLYGPRDLKGLGVLNIWTLDWKNAGARTETIVASLAPAASHFRPLVMRHGASEVTLTERKTYVVGRGRDCALVVPDPEPRVSTTHLQVEFLSGCWFVQDISRNGTWLRDGATTEVRLLPACNKAVLPHTGELSLGRPFADDVEGRFTVRFETPQT